MISTSVIEDFLGVIIKALCHMNSWSKSNVLLDSKQKLEPHHSLNLTLKVLLFYFNPVDTQLQY